MAPSARNDRVSCASPRREATPNASKLPETCQRSTPLLLLVAASLSVQGQNTACNANLSNILIARFVPQKLARKLVSGAPLVVSRSVGLGDRLGLLLG